MDKLNRKGSGAYKNISGEKFNRLTSVCFLRRSPGRYIWLFRCDCGKLVEASRGAVVGGTQKSCGCLKRELRTTHSMSRTREYRIWLAMRMRSGTHPNYQNVRVCRRWRKFENFFSDMGRCPDGYSIDRINNLGHYGPGNCRWASVREQSYNKSSNVWITHNGETRSVMQWSRLLGIPSYVVTRRRQAGWPTELVLNPHLKQPDAVRIGIAIKRGWPIPQVASLSS